MILFLFTLHSVNIDKSLSVYTIIYTYRANSEMEKTRKSATSDIARLEAAVKKSDLQVQSLQKSLDQKVRVLIDRLYNL